MLNCVLLRISFGYLDPICLRRELMVKLFSMKIPSSLLEEAMEPTWMILIGKLR